MAADPRRQIVWLGDLETSAESVNVLCAPHADKLAVPQGWERRDVRDAPRLFAVTATTAPAPATTASETPARRRRSFRKGSPSMADPAEVIYYQTRDLVGAAEASPARPARSGETIATGSQTREPSSITQTTAAMESETTRAPATAAARTVAAGGPLAPGAQRPAWDFRAAASMGDLHRVRAELSADTAALLDAGRDTPLLARAFRTARAAG